MIIGISIFGMLVLSVILVLEHPAFGRLPRGERQKRIEHSPNYKTGYREQGTTHYDLSKTGGGYVG